MLDPAVIVPRRVRGALLLIGATAAGAGIAPVAQRPIVVAAPAPAPAPVVIAIPTPPVVIAIPQPPAPRPCPAPTSTPDRAVGQWLSYDAVAIAGYTQSYPGLVGVATSATSARIAAWTDHGELWLSRDGAATWAPAMTRLDGTPIASAAFDCHDRLFVARGDDVWIVDDGGEQRHAMPAGAGDARLTGSGAWVAWSRGGQVRITGDGGATWRAPSEPARWVLTHPRVRPTSDGTGGWWRIGGTDEAPAALWFHAGGDDFSARPLPSVGGGPQAIGPDGTVYATRGGGVLTAARAGTTVALPTHGWVTSLQTRGDRGLLAASIDDVLLAIEGRSARRGTTWPADLPIAAVDASGLPLTFVRGRLVRWSPRLGWRVVLGEPITPDEYAGAVCDHFGCGEFPRVGKPAATWPPRP